MDEAQVFPLSFAQQRLWFLDQLAPATALYNLPFSLRIRGELNAPALRRSLGEIARRHEALRTTFVMAGEEPAQLVSPPRAVELPVIDLRPLPARRREAELSRLANEEARRPFSLAAGPLLRVQAVRLDGDESILLTTMHHIVTDGWSMRLYAAELETLYACYCAGLPSSLPELPIQYPDYAVWQRQRLQGPVLAGLLAYWKGQLADLPALRLPLDRRRPEQSNYSGAAVTAEFPAEVWDALQKLGRSQGATPFMGLAAVFFVLLQRYTGQDDVVVGTPIAGRSSARLEGLIGFFVNTLVLRADLAGDPSFREVLRRIGQTALDAYSHQELPFEKLVEALHPERDPNRNPLFDVMFQLQNVATVLRAPAGSHGGRVPAVDRAASNFDLAFDLREGPNGLEAYVEYSTELFERETVVRLVGHYRRLLSAVVEDPERRIRELPLIDDGERRQLLAWGQGPVSPVPEVCAHELFERRADRDPQAPALIAEDECLTYAQVEERANRLARRLRGAGAGPGVRVALHAENTPAAIVAVLAVLKAGGAWVPVDPRSPRWRQAFVLEDAGAALLLTRRSWADAAPSTPARVLLLDDAEATEDGARLSGMASPADPAYVMYTSGTTGVPKGVEVCHRALVNHNLGMARAFGLGPGDRVLQFASLTFDVALEEILPTWAAGAAVVLRSDAAFTTPADLLRHAAEDGITVMNLPSTYWHGMVQALEPDQIPAALRLVVIGSERALPERVAAWRRQIGGRIPLINGYGLTETTVTCLLHHVAAQDGAGDPLAELPAGRPIDNTEAYVLDRSGQPAPIGVPGELCVGGAALARGYVNRPELTAERFVAHPFRGDARLFRTGDLARWRRGGEIELLGRTDDQVKVRGVRIEPAEIETALRSHPAVAEAVVVVREDVPGDRRLAAYVVPAARQPELRAGDLATAEQQIDRWRTVYEELYRQPAPAAEPDFNTIGWDSSYTGQPLGDDAMREAVEATAARILASRPRRVLEIGCGTGLLLFRVAPRCESYVGTDFSAAAVEYVERALAAAPLPQVRVARRTADDIDGLADTPFDAIVLNSVVQYFPGVEYLVRVLERAWAALAPGGVLFVGDVRNRRLLEAFHAAVEWQRATPFMRRSQLAARVRLRVEQEHELVLDPELFHALAGHLPAAGEARVELKRGRLVHELTQFRYDVALRKGGESTVAAEPESLDWSAEASGLRGLQDLLERRSPGAVLVRGVPNARVWSAVERLRRLAAADADPTFQEMREEAAGAGAAGVDPEDLWALGERLAYAVEIRWSPDAADRFDAWLHRDGAARPPAAPPAAPDWQAYANDPQQGTFLRRLAPQLRAWLKERLPEPMIPAAFVLVGVLPRTAGGKLDRRALPAPDAGRPEMSAAYVAPRTPAEAALARIWEELLGVQRIGVFDNFFELGGDSILSIQAVTRATQAGLQLTPRQLFQNQTIAALAAVAGTGPRIVAEQGAVTGPVPLTPVQRWFLAQDLADAAHYNQAFLVEPRQPVTGEAVAGAVAALLRHHDALRLRFRRRGAEWEQHIAEPEDAAVPFEHVRLAAASEVERAAAEVQAGLDLERGPLLRAVLFDIAGQPPRQSLLLLIHHLAVDGVSWRILLEDLGTAVAQTQRGEPVALPAKTTSFRAWAERLAGFAASPAAASELPYWLSCPRDAAAPLPMDEPGGRNLEATADQVWVALAAADTRALLRESLRVHHAQINDVLLAALAHACARWSGRRTLLVHLEGHGREPLFDDVDLSRTAGWFTTIFPVWLTADPAASPAAAVARAGEQLRRIPNRGLGFGVLRYLGAPAQTAELRGLPEAEISFNYFGQLDSTFSETGAWRQARETTGRSRSPRQQRSYLLDVNAVLLDGSLQVGWTYSSAVHRRQTIEALAGDFVSFLRDLARAGRTQAGPSRAAAAIEDAYPLSPLQQGLLFHTLAEPEAGLYVEQMSWTFRGGWLDVRAFEHAWSAVIARHAIFRTAFEWEGAERPRQVVLSHAGLPLEELDWRGWPPEVQRQRMDDLLAGEGSRGFDLAAPPLMRLKVIHLADDRHDFVWSSHHLLLDGWSMPLVLNEMFHFYEAHREGREAVLAPARPYRDYISWLADQDLDAARRYWREVLAGAEVPTPMPRAARAAGLRRSRSLELQLSGAASEALSSLARHQRVTLNTIFQSVWALLLARYSGRDDVVFGGVVSGRPAALPGVEAMVGLFINALPVRVRVPGDASLTSWWQELQAQQAEQRQYEFCSLIDIRQWSGLAADRPLFETLVGFENYPVPRTPQAAASGAEPGLQITDVRSQSRINYPLTAMVVPGPPVRLRLLYDAGRVDDATAGRMLEHVRSMLELCAGQPGQSALELASALPPAERRTIQAWSAVTADYPRDAAVHELFARRAERHPDAPAVEFAGDALSYGELERRANRLARTLRRLGVATAAPVGVCLPRSAELIVALLAVLKAGGAYVPLDPEYPAARLRLMLADSGAKVLLTAAALGIEWPESCRAVNLDADRAAIEAERETALPGAADGGSPAYVMYTSGSTGRPKGTVIPHRAIARLVLATSYVRLTPHDRVAQASNASFDAATFEIWGALLNGATLVGVQRDDVLDPERLARLIRGRRLTVMFLTTGLFNQIARVRPAAFAPLGCLLFGGERADAAAVGEVLAHGRPRRLVNAYGPTECTTFATWYEVSGPADGDTLPIGRPLANTEVHLLDRRMNPVPIGAPGEICLGGDGLALGYLHNPGLTAERFVPNPFGDGTRLYRTGDLGRHGSAGDVEFLGRLDDQVKLRGFRVEPSEVRAALLAHPEVRDAAVVSGEDGAGGRRLIAYVVAGGLAEEDLRRHLARLLPAFMIPAFCVRLEALPLNANGKVDRHALPPPPGDGAGHAAPRTAVEQRMLAIWRAVLGRESIGVDQSFFELGGHSLNAIQLVCRIRDEFQVELPLQSLFQSPVAAQLAAEVEERLNNAGPGRQPTPAARPPHAGPLPLSFAQQRLWLMNRMAGSADAYNVPAAVRLRPGLDPEVLERSLGLLVERHESLRTAFVETGSGPVQVIAPAARVPWRVEDLRHLPPRRREEAAARLAAEQARQPFDLAAAPLMRAALVWLSDGAQLLLLTFHHLVIDGWSMQVFFRELNQACAALERGRLPEWPALPFQYSDYVQWQRAWLENGEAAAQEVYWRGRLAGLESLELPADRPRPAVPDDRGSQQSVTLPRGLSAVVRDLGRAERVTTFMVLLGALGSLLARVTGQQDFALGAPTAGRVGTRWEPLIGVFLNTLVLRLDLGGNPRFRQTLARVREVTLEAYSHQELPFERVQQAAGRAPLFNVFFNLLSFGDTPPPARGPETGIHAPFDLSIYASEHAGGALSISMIYPDDRFEHASVRLMLEHLTAVLAAVTADPELPLAALPLATAEAPRRERPPLLWRDGVARSIAQRFDEQALAHPARAAVESGPLTWTYARLRQESRRIAGLIRERCGAGEGRLGLLLGHDARAVAALLGALRCGKCYVPLDAEDAAERLAHIVADADLQAILTDEAHLVRAQALARGRCQVLSLHEAAAGDRDGDREPDASVPPDAPAYILYTSGSTGRPKGVVQTHRGVLGHIGAYSAALGIAPHDRLALVASLGVDAAVMDVFGALLNGAALCLFDVRRGGLEDLPPWLRAGGITIYHSTPTVYRYLAGALPAAGVEASRLRLVVLGGEEVVRRDFELFRQRFPRGCQLVNGFGPTESTLALQQFLDHESAVTRGAVPLGTPVAGTEIALLDPTGAEIAGAGVGEIEIRSESVAAGYWRDPAATAAAFHPDPRGGRWRRYRTGDLARRLGDGRYEFVGRRDEQVKVNGRRVELGEVEACLASSPDVREACVSARRDAAGALRLIGYLVPARQDVDRHELRRFLQRRLPAYMMPSDLVIVADLPRTASGKIDRRRLPPGSPAAGWAREYCAPRTPQEALLARLWQDVLGVDRVGVHDDFFELGGHSLLAARLASRIRETFAVEMPLRRIFEAPSVDLLAAEIGRAAPAEPAASDLMPAPRQHRRARLAPTSGDLNP